MSYKNKPVGHLRALYEFLLTGIATLTNKTLTAPTITTPTFNNTFLKGSRFHVTYSNFAAADIAKSFWISPVACKMVEAKERHVTVAGQAGTMQIEKVPSGTAIGSGAATLAAAFDLTSTANTVVTKTAVTTADATLAAGDMLALKLASGNAASLALATVTVTMEVV